MGPESEDAIARRSAIVGGHTVDTDPSIVMIYAYGRGAGTCTGAVIAPRAVLTAAHCIDKDELGDVNFVVYNGGFIDDAQFSDLIRAKEGIMHPDYDGSSIGAGFDLGLLIFEKDLFDKRTGQPFAPLPWMRKPVTDDLTGQDARLVGYGVTSGDENAYDSGVKRETSTPLSAYDDNFLQFDSTEHNMCSGDSGGPVLMQVDGVETVVGVNSFVSYPYCESGGYSSRVDIYLDWIDSTIEAKTGWIHPTKRPTKVLGDACAEHKECTSGLCVFDFKTAAGYCSTTCDPKAAAPTGYQCTKVDGNSLLIQGTPKKGCDLTGGGDVGAFGLLFMAAMGLASRRSRGAAPLAGPPRRSARAAGPGTRPPETA